MYVTYFISAYTRRAGGSSGHHRVSCFFTLFLLPLFVPSGHSYMPVSSSSFTEITTTALPTTPLASTPPMTTFGGTITAPITVPGTTPVIECEEGRADCVSETETPDYDDLTMGKTQIWFILLSISASKFKKGLNVGIKAFLLFFL